MTWRAIGYSRRGCLFGTSALIGAPEIPYWHFLSRLPHQYFPLNLNSVNIRCISTQYCCVQFMIEEYHIQYSLFLAVWLRSMICQCVVHYCGNLFWRLAAQSGGANTFDSFIFQEIYCSHNPGKYLQICWTYFSWQPQLKEKAAHFPFIICTSTSQPFPSDFWASH